MTTTIQIDERTLLLLKKLREELKAKSYDETIRTIVINKPEKDVLCGSLKHFLRKGETSKDIVSELQKERRKSDRF